MTRKWLGCATALLLSGTAVSASQWTDLFKTVDADGNGRVSRTEWEAAWPKLKIEPVPTFTAMDTDGNNSIDPDEWAAAEKMVKAFPESCKSAASSWCEKKY